MYTQLPANHWWRQAKFGMFIHWGLYAQLGGVWNGTAVRGNSEWIQYRLGIPSQDYAALAGQFNPEDFNADAWVQVAKDAGMQYIVITAKHHDGFAMFRSADPYNIVDATPFGRDPMEELAEACRRHGIRLCFYYSHVLDWHDPDAFEDDIPLSELDRVQEKNQAFRAYLERKVKPQLSELLCHYGPVGMIWFDMPGCVDKTYCQEIRDHVKSLQPDCLISGRIGYGLGDFITVGDNKIPQLPCDIPWEMPGTINDTWGFKRGDRDWKSSSSLIRRLIKIVSRGGNYLLNVGPDARGRIPDESIRILHEMGEHLRRNSAAFYGTEAAPLYPYDMSEDGLFTYSPGKLYYHSLKFHEKLSLSCIKKPIRRVTLLSSGRELPFIVSYSEATQSHDLVIDFPDACEPLPVFCIEIEGNIPEFENIFI